MLSVKNKTQRQVSVLTGGEIKGYQKKSTKLLIKEIDECKTLSQLFALIQHEGITIQMTGQVGASNLVPKKLGPKEIIDKKDTPFERLKAQVRKSVLEDAARRKRSEYIAKREREKSMKKNNKKK